MLTQQEIKDLITSGGIAANQDNIVKQGVLKRDDGVDVDYQLHVGWDFVQAYTCDSTWGPFNIKLMDFIQKQNYDAATLAGVFADIQVDDAHWDWFAKSLHFKTAEYVWFFLVADGKPQGACMIYHPKKSVFEEGEIFYIEYVAVAPWNRKNPMQPRVFKGVGSLLIKHAIQHATTVLNLKHGFCLHALKRAASFYAGIGMHPDPKLDKPNLQYFEMPDKAAADFMVAP